MEVYPNGPEPHLATSAGRLPRIAFVTTVYDQTDVGGGTFVDYLRKAVRRGELDIMFFSDDMVRQESSSECSVAIPERVRRLPGGWVVRSRFYRDAVTREHNKRPFDLVWHNNAITAYADVTSRERIAPVVGMVNDYNNADSKTPWTTRDKFGTKRAAIRFFWRQIESFVTRRLDFVIVNSRFMAERIGSSYSIDPDRIKLLYKGVDARIFSGEETSSGEETNGDGQVTRILFVKRDYVRGGLLDLLQALAGLPKHVRLTIVGPRANDYKHILEVAGVVGVIDRVDILDALPRDQMPALYRQHDILCVPSRSEALGVALLEGLASGIPVISTDVGGIPEVLDDGRAGLLVSPTDVDAIREGLQSLIVDASLRTELISSGKSQASRFSVETMISNMRKLAGELSVGDS